MICSVSVVTPSGSGVLSGKHCLGRARALAIAKGHDGLRIGNDALCNKRKFMLVDLASSRYTSRTVFGTSHERERELVFLVMAVYVAKSSRT